MEAMVTQTLDFMRGLGGTRRAAGGHQRAGAAPAGRQQAMGRTVEVQGQARHR
jgi:hypothetical protein